MADLQLTRSLFLKCLATVYLVAFLSLYTQIPGLLGAGGLLPAQSELSRADAGGWAVPLRWLRARLALDTEHTLDAVCLAGAALSVMAALADCCRLKAVFAALLALYGMLVAAGQVFLFYQWDSLLLEAGLLAVVLAPWLPAGGGRRAADPVGLWLVRWLLFRQVFSTGVVKLASQCPSWWSLTALDVHFQSQCLPSPLARLAHQLPPSVLRLTTAASLAVELGTPLLMFAPLRTLRLAAFYLQVLLQLAVLATGSFGFHTLLVITLCVSLLDDDWIAGKRSRQQQQQGGGGRLQAVLSGVTLLALAAAAVALFGVRLQDGALTADIGFSADEFAEFVHFAVPASVLLAAASFLLTAADGITSAALDSPGGCCRRLHAALGTAVTVLAAAGVLTCSLVPYTMLDEPSHRALPAPLRDAFADHVQPLHAFGSYGLFRQMTGVSGRPEVVLQGAGRTDGPWHDIELRYKPGDVSTAPLFVAPHQPRLDWQMWMAALGDYHANPWLTALAHRLLTGQRQAVQLLDAQRYPFSADKPPRYVRAVRYTYRYTGPGGGGDWWQRSQTAEPYLPVFSADHQPLLDYLRQLQLMDLPAETSDSPALIGLLDAVRAALEPWEARTLIWAVMLAVWLAGALAGRLMGTAR